MNQLEDYFHIELSHDQMSAQLHYKESYEERDMSLDESTFRSFLDAHHIVYGIVQEKVAQLLSNLIELEFPLVIANGLPVIDGEDGKIQYELNLNTKLEKTSDWDFRNVMRIPSVVKGQKLATIFAPTEGVEGINVKGNPVPAKPGKPVAVKAGKNVVFREENMSFYAATDGQISIVGNYIHIQPVYQVPETLSMKTGNLDFTGTVIIHGDVPTGFHVKADGDVKIFGMVEAAEVIAGGSVYVSEGMAGQGTGFIKAGENITIGYINQGNVHAENDLYVENSILHSECVADGHIFCQKGNIIGGSLSAGKAVEAKDIGNRLSTKTEIIFGLNKKISNKEDELLAKQKELKETLRKLALIGSKLEKQDMVSNPKLRISFLRQKNSVRKTEGKLEMIEGILEKMNSSIGSEKEAYLIVRNFIHQNTIVAFGKYQKKITSSHHYVKMNLVNNEIKIHPLFD
ncbi:DUF342 domain-containing protein [Oceanobacillus saliphilus]|uniref:DUF342 domain-containing protein n=1 Tax=Oceanobacillus saliphilus TaxID=2925834 RepID=UPI00201DA557|nr:FapA family protein [Oceanobacillus saliphilus]